METGDTDNNLKPGLKRASRGPKISTKVSQTERQLVTLTVAVLNRCIVKITGEMTLSFPTGIIKVFTNNPSPAVLTFKLKNTSRLEQILPNQQLLYR